MKWKIESKKARYLLVGLLVDLIVLVAGFLLIVLESYFNYDGKCPNFIMLDSGYTPCSFSDYLQLNLFLALIMLLLVWWITVPALLLPPLVGFLIGFLKSRTPASLPRDSALFK